MNTLHSFFDNIKQSSFKLGDIVTNKSINDNNDLEQINENDTNREKLQKLKEIDLNTINVLSQTELDKYCKTILNLDQTFPDNILNSKSGKKFQELEFFYTNDNDNTNSFFNNINKCYTNLGRLNLQNIIINPTTNINVLQNRQSCIKYLLSLPKNEINNIQTNLQQISTLENDIISNLRKNTDEFKQLLSIIYFESRFLQKVNYSKNAMLFYYVFTIYFTPVYSVIAPIIMLLSPYVILRFVLGANIGIKQYISIMKNMMLKNSGVTNGINMFISKISDKDTGSLSFNFFLKLVKLILTIINSSVGKYSYLIFMLITYFYAIYNNINNSITLNKIINYFHQKLNNISYCISFAYETYHKYQLFNLDELISLKHNLESSFNNQFIVELLNSKTIGSPISHLSNKGDITVLFKKLLDDKNNNNTILSPILTYIAHLDTWIGLSTLYTNYQNNEHSNITFTNYILNDSPIINAENIWNICCQEPIGNDFNMGTVLEQKVTQQDNIDNVDNEDNIDNVDNEDNIDNDSDNSDDDNVDNEDNIDNVSDNSDDDNVDNVDDVDDVDDKLINNTIITGPNGSGKSTFIKSLMESIILSQTVGISLSNKFEMTPFNNLTTYLNIPDCQGRESLFQAEMDRCYHYLNQIKEQENNNELSFNIIDEIFVSTNYQEGMSGACAVVNNLSNYNKCLNIIITHFDLLSNLENKNIQHKYFTIDLDEDNNLICDYKIRNGINDKHLALKLLRKKGFDNDLVDEAEQIYNKITNKK